MRYPESKMSLDSAMPTSSIQAWLGQELETRGIDAMIYTRCILSILQQDSFEFEHIESDLFPMKKDLVQVKKEFSPKGKTKMKKGDRRWSVDGEEMKKTAAVECLMSVTEKDEGLKNLVEETYRKLKEQQHLVETTCEVPVSVCVTPVATSASPGATSPPIPAVVCVPEIEESLMKEEPINTTREGYYDAFPALLDKDGIENLPTPNEKSNATIMTVWHKKNAKLSPATSDVERTTPNELNQERPASNPLLRRSQSRRNSGESDDGQKVRKSRNKSRDHGTSSPGQDQRKSDHGVNKYGSKSVESYAKGSRGRPRSHSYGHGQRYRSRSQEKFSGGRNKHTPRPYVFYKLKSNREPKGQFGKDVNQSARNRVRQPGPSFFTPRYPISPAKLGKAPKFSDSLKITDDILRLLYVRPEQEQWFDDLVSGNFPRHPIRVGHHPRKPRRDNDDVLLLYDGPIDTVFPASETRQGRLYERHSCSSVDDLVMAADVTDKVTTVDATDTKKSSRFLPFILGKDDDLDDFDIRLSLSMIEKDSQGSEDESTPRQDDTQQLAGDTDAFVPELVKTELSKSEDHHCKPADVNLDDGCRKLVVSSCDSDDTLKTSSSSDSESTEEDEYDFSKFTEFIENKKKGLNGIEALSDGMTDKSRSEKLALQIDGAQSRGISLLRELQPGNSDWLKGDEESSGSDDEQRCSPNLAKEKAVSHFELKDDLLSGANEQQPENVGAEKESSVLLDVESEEKCDSRGGRRDAETVVSEEFDDKEVVETVLDIGAGGDAREEETCAEAEQLESEIPKTHTDQQDVGTQYKFPKIVEIKPDDEVARHGEADSVDLKVAIETKKSYVDGLEEMFERLGVFGKAIGSICNEIKKIEDVGATTGDVEKSELPSLKTEDSEPNDVPALVHPDEKDGSFKKVNNLTVDAALSNKLQGSTQDTSLLSPNRSRLDGFPALLPKEEDVSATADADDEDLSVAKNFVNIDLQTENGFGKLQELSTFLEFSVEDIKDLLPQEESLVVTSADTAVEDVVALEPKSTPSSKSNIPRYLSDNIQNENVVLSQNRAAESADDDVKMQVFTVPASSLKQMEGVFLTKDDVVVRITDNDSSDEEATDESDTESTSTTCSDGYSEILGDLDSVLAGINISSDDITADMAENSVQFLEDLKLLDDSLDTSLSDENSCSDVACCGDAWTISDEDVILSQFPSSQTESVHSGLQRSLSDTSDHGELPQPELDHPNAVIGCDNTWSISKDDMIQTKQYKQLNNNQNEQIHHHSLHRSQSERNDLGRLAHPVPCSSEAIGRDTWSIMKEDAVRPSNDNFVLPPSLHRSLSDHSDIMIRGDTWSVSEEDTIKTTQLNNNQGTLPVIHSGLHRSFSNRSDHGLLPPVINITSNLDALNNEVIVQDHDKTADSGISQYAEENCEMAENIALATCGNLSSDGDSSCETSDSPCFDSPEETPLAKHIAALTRRRHPGIGKKWPPSTTKDSQDDGYGEGQVCPEPDNAKNLLQVDNNEPWIRSNISQTYLGSPRNPDLATWGSISETTGSTPVSKDHSPWPTLDNMFSAENSDWQDRSTPILSSSSSHSMRKVDADWHTLQPNTTENAGIGEPLYVNVTDASLDNNNDTLYYLPSLSDSPKVEDLLAEASSMLDSMDHESFHQLLVDIENQSDSEAENMGDFSEALQKLAVNQGNYTVLQELDKLFQTYMHAEGLSDDDKLLMDAVDDLAQFTEHDANRCMSPGGEEYSGEEDQYEKKHNALGNVGQGDPTYNLWNNSGKEFSGHLNWYIGGEDSVVNLNKGHSCNDIAYWSDTELIDEKPDLVIHTSASYGHLASLTRKRSRHQHSTAGSYIGLSHSQSAHLQPSEFSAFKDIIPGRMAYVRSEPHLASQSHRVLANFKSDSDLLKKTAPVITLQNETKATIGKGYNKNMKKVSDLVSSDTHFLPIPLDPDEDGYDGKAATGTAQAAIRTAIQHVEKPPLFSFSPDPDEDYQLFVTSDSDGEASFVPKFKVKLDGEKWSQTDKPKKGRAVGEGKLKTTGSFTDDCIETCRKKLEQCSQEILLQCRKYMKIQLTDAILEEEDSSGCQEEDDEESFEESASDRVMAATCTYEICDHNGNVGEACSGQTEDSQESEKTDVVLSCHDRDCFCPECGIERQVAAPEPYWSSSKSFYSCSGLGMDKKIVENRDGESLQGGSVKLGQNVNILYVQDKQCCDLERNDIESHTSDSHGDARLERGQDLGCDKRKDVEYLDIMALCNTVDLMQVGDESPQDMLSNGKNEDMEKPVISTEGGSGVISPQVPVQDVAEIWATGADLDVFTITAEAVTKKYSIWSVGGDIGLPSLPADVSGDLIMPECLISGATNTLKEKPCSEDTTSDEAKEEPYILMEDEAFALDQSSNDNEDFDLAFIQPPHRPRAFYSSELEEVWMRTPELSDFWYNNSRRKRRSRSGSISNKPCSFYMEGNCRREDCRFSHDLSSITCHFWKSGDCFKGVTCPFMHAYNSSEKKSFTKQPESFTLENIDQDYPQLSQESKSDEEKFS